MQAAFERAALHHRLGIGGGTDPTPVTAADLDALPAPAARYLRYAGVLGHPRDWLFRAELTGQFRRRLSASRKPFRSLQYNAAEPAVGRLFSVRNPSTRTASGGSESYIAGRGRAFVFEQGPGELAGPEQRLSGLAAWLNDAILLAPSMLIHPRTLWRETGEGSFGVTVTDAGNTTSAEIFLNRDGSVRDVRTKDRWINLPSEPTERCAWSTPVERWQRRGRRALPVSGKVIWLLPQGAFTHADYTLAPDAIAFNVAPTGHPT